MFFYYKKYCEIHEHNYLHLHLYFLRHLHRHHLHHLHHYRRHVRLPRHYFFFIIIIQTLAEKSGSRPTLFKSFDRIAGSDDELDTNMKVALWMETDGPKKPPGYFQVMLGMPVMIRTNYLKEQYMKP